MVQWFKMLLSMVRDYSKRKPVIATIKRKDGSFESFQMERHEFEFDLPEVVAKPFNEGDFPEVTKYKRYRKVHGLASHETIYCLYEEL